MCLASFLAFFLFFLFCRKHLRSVSFSACLALVLVFRVSVYPSSHFYLDSAWCRIFGDFLSWVMSKSNWKLYMELRPFSSSVASDCHFHSRVYFFAWFKHFDIVQKTTKTICPCPYCSLGNILTVRQERNVTWYLDWSDCSKSVAFLEEALW